MLDIWGEVSNKKNSAAFRRLQRCFVLVYITKKWPFENKMITEIMQAHYFGKGNFFDSPFTGPWNDICLNIKPYVLVEVRAVTNGSKTGQGEIFTAEKDYVFRYYISGIPLVCNTHPFIEKRYLRWTPFRNFTSQKAIHIRQSLRFVLRVVLWKVCKA